MNETTRTPEQIILDQIWSVCTDGNSDAPRVAKDIIGALYGEGWQILPTNTIQPLDTAPRDGSPFWGIVGENALRMLWHPKFKAFVSNWRRMTMAPGCKLVDPDGTEHSHQDHSPVTHEPIGWMPLPKGME